MGRTNVGIVCHKDVITVSPEPEECEGDMMWVSLDHKSFPPGMWEQAKPSVQWPTDPVFSVGGTAAKARATEVWESLQEAAQLCCVVSFHNHTVPLHELCTEQASAMKSWFDRLAEAVVTSAMFNCTPFSWCGYQYLICFLQLFCWVLNILFRL